MGVARRGASGLRSRGGGGLARASGQALGGGCPFQAAVQPGLLSAPATPPARVPSALGLWGAVWPPSVDVSTLPRRDPARLTPACPSRGPQAIRVRDEGTVLVAFCRRPPCGRSRGFRRSLRHARARPARASAPGTRVLFVGPAAHTVVRGSGCPRGNRRGHEGAARAAPPTGGSGSPSGPFAARGPQLLRPHPLSPTFALTVKTPRCPLAVPRVCDAHGFAFLATLPSRIWPPETSGVFRAAQPGPGAVSCTAAFPRTRLRPTSGGVTRARAPRTPVPSPSARAGRTVRREHDGHPTKGRREDEPRFLKTFG